MTGQTHNRSPIRRAGETRFGLLRVLCGNDSEYDKVKVGKYDAHEAVKNVLRRRKTGG